METHSIYTATGTFSQMSDLSWEKDARGEWRMYNLVACYDTLELKSRGDVLSDKVSSQSWQTYKRCSKWRSTSTCPLHHLHFVPTIPSIVKHRLHVCCLLTRPPLRPGVSQLPGLARRRPQDLPIRVHPHRHDPRPQVTQTTVLLASAFYQAVRLLTYP